jgi:hypothetical protein
MFTSDEIPAYGLTWSLKIFTIDVNLLLNPQIQVIVEPLEFASEPLVNTPSYDEHYYVESIENIGTRC